MMEEVTEIMVQPYSLPFDDHLMGNSLPEWNKNDEFINMSDEEGVVVIIPDSKDESLNTFLLNDDGDVIDFKSMPVIDHNNPLFDDEINGEDLDNLFLQIEVTNRSKKIKEHICNVPRSNSVPIFSNYKEDYLACIEEAVSPKSTFNDIDQLTPPKCFSVIEPTKFSPEKNTPVISKVPIKSRGKTLRRMVSSMSGLRKIAIPKDAILSSDDEISSNCKRKIKLIHVTPEFQNQLRRSNRIAKVPIRNLKFLNTDKTSPGISNDIIKVNENISASVEVMSPVKKKAEAEIEPSVCQNNIDKSNNYTEEELVDIFQVKSDTSNDNENLNASKSIRTGLLENLKVKNSNDKESLNCSNDKMIETNIRKQSILLKKDIVHKMIKSNINEDTLNILSKDSANYKKITKQIIKKKEKNAKVKLTHSITKIEDIKIAIVSEKLNTIDSKNKNVLSFPNKHSNKMKKSENSKKLLHTTKTEISSNNTTNNNDKIEVQIKSKRLLKPSESTLVPIMTNKSKKPIAKRNSSHAVFPSNQSISKPQELVSSSICKPEIDLNSQRKCQTSQSIEKIIHKKTKFTKSSLKISIDKVINKIQPKIQNKTKLIEIQNLKPKSKETSILVKKEIKKTETTGTSKMNNNHMKMSINEFKHLDLPTVPITKNYSKKLTLSSYRKRRKLRPKSVLKGTIIIPVKEPFFKNIPDHSYCNKHKGLTTVDNAYLNVEQTGNPKVNQPFSNRIRHDTDNNVVDMDIDSEVESNEIKNKQSINIHIDKHPMTNNESLKSRLQPTVNPKQSNNIKNNRNKGFCVSSPDSAVQSESTSPSSDSNNDINNGMQSANSTDSGISECNKKSFMSTFKPVDTTVSHQLPVIYDIHETPKVRNLKRNQSVLANNSKQLYVTNSNETTKLSYSLNNNNKSYMNNNKVSSNERKPFDGYSSSENGRQNRQNNINYISDSSDQSDYNNSNVKIKRKRRSSYRSSPMKRSLMEYKRKEFEERRTVYVGRIPSYYTSSNLERKFESFGLIDNISIHLRDEGDNYGFITFRYTNDAFNAIENGNRKDECEDFDMCFGGRRHFCKQKYADLDGNLQDDEECGPNDDNNVEMDFDAMLRAAQRSIKKR